MVPKLCAKMPYGAPQNPQGHPKIFKNFWRSVAILSPAEYCLNDFLKVVHSSNIRLYYVSDFWQTWVFRICCDKKHQLHGNQGALCIQSDSQV